MTIKKELALATALLTLLAIPLQAQEQDEKRGNETATQVRMKNLQARKNALQQRIDTEDRKRDQWLEGVSREKMEQLNKQQDSLCLQLRSDLTDIELEMAELKKAARLTPEETLQQAQRRQLQQEAQQLLNPGKKPAKKPAGKKK